MNEVSMAILTVIKFECAFDGDISLFSSYLSAHKHRFEGKLSFS